MNDTYADSAQPAETVREAPRADKHDAFVPRVDRNTSIVAAAAFAVGVLVGFVLD